MRRKYNVNLVLKKKEKIGEDIVYFLLHYFRYILVVTQIIIIFVFFYRLKVDQDIVDLNDILRQQKEIIVVIQPFVEDIREKYSRMEKVKEILEKQDYIKEQMDYLLSVFPAKFYLTKMALTKDKVSLEGKSEDYITIMRFRNRLKKDNRFSKVDLQSVKKEEVFFSFTIELSGFKLDKVEK